MKTKKIIVKICAGTHCYLMGGSDLQLFSEYLDESVKENISIVGSACLGNCDAETGCKPPFAMVNDITIQQATIQSILELVKIEIET